jgi:hypothetical protein
MATEHTRRKKSRGLKKAVLFSAISQARYPKEPKNPLTLLLIDLIEIKEIDNLGTREG